MGEIRLSPLGKKKHQAMLLGGLYFCVHWYSNFLLAKGDWGKEANLKLRGVGRVCYLKSSFSVTMYWSLRWLVEVSYPDLLSGNNQLVLFYTQWDKPVGPVAVFPTMGEGILQRQLAGKCMDPLNADPSFKCGRKWRMDSDEQWIS